MSEPKVEEKEILVREADLQGTLKLLEKWEPQVEKIPQLEKEAAEMRESVSGLRNLLDESRKARESDKDAASDRKEIEITLPEVALEHYTVCPNCKPKFDNWLKEHGYGKGEQPTVVAGPAAGPAGESATHETGTKSGRLRALDWKHGSKG